MSVFTKKNLERMAVMFLAGSGAAGLVWLTSIDAVWAVVLAPGIAGVLGVITRPVGDADTPSVVQS